MLCNSLKLSACKSKSKSKLFKNIWQNRIGHFKKNVHKKKLICLGSIMLPKQPHQTSDMLTKFKMIFLCTFQNVDDLASKCKNNYGAVAKIGKVMKD